MRNPETMLSYQTWHRLGDLAYAYSQAPLLQGYGARGFCIGCGFNHNINYPNCVWLKDIG